jgi:hypothetical protein
MNAVLIKSEAAGGTHQIPVSIKKIIFENNYYGLKMSIVRIND